MARSSRLCCAGHRAPQSEAFVRTTEISRGAPRPYAQASDRRTLVEATGYRPSLRRPCPRVEALFFSIPLCPLRSELGKRAKGHGSSTGSPPRKGTQKLGLDGRPPGFASQKLSGAPPLRSLLAGAHLAPMARSARERARM